jgi:hypothetical protein
MKRNRAITPAIPFIFLSDTDGEQVFGNVANQFHTWDNIILKTSDFIYVADMDKIRINKGGSGFYDITFEVSWKTVQTLREIWTDLYVNGVEVKDSHIHTFVAGAGGQPTYRDQHVLHYPIYLEYGDYIQIASRSSNTNVTTDPKSSRLIIKLIPMEGWNNRSGGYRRTQKGVF